MRRSFIGLSSFLVLAGCLLLGGRLPARADHAPIDIIAKNFSFTPTAIEAHVGEETVLNVTSAEGVHGIASPELGIGQTTLVPDKTVQVKFTPKKAGTFPVHCSIVCGVGHDKMMFTVTVLP